MTDRIEVVLLQALADLRAEVRGLRLEVARGRSGASDDGLLGLIDQHFGGVVFSSADLMARAATDQALSSALAARRLQTASSIGKRLSALARHASHGQYSLNRNGRDATGALFSVVSDVNDEDADAAASAA